MKKVKFKIRKGLRTFLLGVGLIGATAFISSKRVPATSKVAIAFVSPFATMRKSGTFDKLDEGTKAFAEALETFLEKSLTDKVEAKDIDEKIEAFKKGLGKTLTDEQLTQMKEAADSVKSLAAEFEKLKDQGFTAEKVLPFPEAMRKALEANTDKFKALKGEKNNGFEINFKAAAAMGVGTNIQAAAQPYMPTPQIQQGLMEAPRNQPFILDFCDVESSASPTIVWFNKTGRQDGTAFIAEGTLKPLSDFEIDSEKSNAKKVAHAFNVSEEMLSDIPFIDAEIRKEGLTNIKLKIEDGILNGDGTGQNLNGIVSLATGYALAALNDTVPNANEYDAMLAAHTQLTTLNFNPNVVFVHPVTRFKLRTLKDNQDRYLILPASDSNATTIDGLPMVAKNQIPVGKFLMADMSKSHVRFVMDITIKVGYSGDDFRENRVTFLIEARLHHYISNVERAAFIYDDFATVKAALEAAV